MWLIAQNPKTEHNLSYPLEGTKSGDTIIKWVTSIAYDCNFLVSNASNTIGKPIVTEDDMSRLREEYSFYRPEKIITFGRVAERTISELGWEYFKMPHPSGLNRKLNNRHYVDKMIQDMVTYIRSI